MFLAETSVETEHRRLVSVYYSHRVPKWKFRLAKISRNVKFASLASILYEQPLELGMMPLRRIGKAVRSDILGGDDAHIIVEA